MHHEELSARERAVLFTLLSQARKLSNAELEALKPGNVHIHAGGHGMTVRDFLMSAEAAAKASQYSEGLRFRAALKKRELPVIDDWVKKHDPRNRVR